jgi:hypothetical protein
MLVKKVIYLLNISVLNVIKNVIKRGQFMLKNPKEIVEKTPANGLLLYYPVFLLSLAAVGLSISSYGDTLHNTLVKSLLNIIAIIPMGIAFVFAALILIEGGKSIIKRDTND